MKYILWFAAATIIALGSASVAKAQVAVIANPSVTENSLDANTLLSIYMLNKRNWSDGSRIVVFDLKDDLPSKSKFYGRLGKSPKAMKQTWLRLKLTGEAQPPRTAGTEESMAAMVASTPGAIGYCDAGKAGGNVKVLLKLN
jgi:ABC-type phosphate transport system substrate-binding protein